MSEDKHTRFSIYMPLELKNKISQLTEHIKEETGHILSRSEFINEAVFYYFNHLCDLETKEAIFKKLLERNVFQKDTSIETKRQIKMRREKFKKQDEIIDIQSTTHSNSHHAKEKTRSANKTKPNS